MSFADLRNKYQIARSSAQYIIENINKHLKKSGRKEKLTKCDKRKIISSVEFANKERRKLSSLDIKLDLRLDVSRNTICRFLKVKSYNYRNVPSKFKLSFKIKQKRLDFAKRKILDFHPWQKTVFTDEKLFTLKGCDSYYCWMKKNQCPTRIKSVLRSPGLMVWGMLLPNGLLSYRLMIGKQNAQKYISILQSSAIPIMKINFKEAFIFQQDNCPIHVAAKTKTFLQNQDIDVMEWPAYSPDINIIENVWAILSNYVYADGKIENLSVLKSRISLAFKRFNEENIETVNKLYSSIPSRLLSIITKRGDRINY